MRRWSLGIIVCSWVLVALASAAPSGAAVSPSHTAALRHVLGNTVPAAWAGVWTYTDTTYDCTTGAPTIVSAGADTICAGEYFLPDSSSGITLNCTGTATDTQADVTCTGSMEMIPGCAGAFVQTQHMTRTGETAYFIFYQTISFTPPGCGIGFPDQCTHTNSHMTRTGPAPVEYCATPVRPSSWGQLKTRYN